MLPLLMVWLLPLLTAHSSLLPEFRPTGVFQVPFGNRTYPRPLPDLFEYPPPMPDLPFPLMRTRGGSDRDEALVPRDAQDGVVGTGPAGRRIDEDEHVLVQHRRRRGLRKHDVELRRAKHRLRRVERQPSQLGFDQIGAVLPPPVSPFAFDWTNFDWTNFDRTNYEGARGSPASPS